LYSHTYSVIAIGQAITASHIYRSYCILAEKLLKAPAKDSEGGRNEPKSNSEAAMKEGSSQRYLSIVCIIDCGKALEASTSSNTHWLSAKKLLKALA